MVTVASLPKFILVEDYIGPEIIAVDEILRVFVKEENLWIEFKQDDYRSILLFNNHEKATKYLRYLQSILIEG